MENRRMQLLPFWLPQMDIDIRKPPSNFRLQRPTTSNPTTPANESANPLSETEDDRIEVLVDNQENDEGSDGEDVSEGTPLLAHSSRSVPPSQNSRAPHLSSLEELEEYLAESTPAGMVPTTF